MIRSLDSKTTKTGKPFGVLVLEDFTGSSEIMLWGETFVPARDAGLIEPGRIIKLKCAIQVDDRTGGRRLTGYELGELKPKRGLQRQGPAGTHAVDHPPQRVRPAGDQKRDFQTPRHHPRPAAFPKQRRQRARRSRRWIED
jgi:DNA polymerase III alpha subunit